MEKNNDKTRVMSNEHCLPWIVMTRILEGPIYQGKLCHVDFTQLNIIVKSEIDLLRVLFTKDSYDL